jgi:hypothetical protein
MPQGEQHGQKDEHHARRDESGRCREEADTKYEQRRAHERDPVCQS